MVSIELNKADAVALREILESARQDLRTERVRTENREFHSNLSQRESILDSVITQLEKEQEEQ